MDDKNKTFLVVAFVVVLVLFLIFGGGMATGFNMGGGMMGGGTTGGGTMGGWTMGGFSWMWLPTLLFLGLGALLGWMIWGKK